MDATDVIAAVVSVHITLTVSLFVLVGRLRDRMARLEEWVRLMERRENRRKDDRGA